MAVDTPAKIAVLGAGPMGLETALYARFLGYEVALYDRGRTLEHLRQTAHVRWFTPFRMNRSSLGLAAIRAQEPSWQFPPDDAVLTAGEMIEAYWQPLAQSDLLADCLQEQTEVVQVGRGELRKTELVGDEARREFSFRLLLRNAGAPGSERIEEADVVIDATGTYGQSNWLGAGGIPAIGERQLAQHIEYRLPDILNAARGQYAGRHTLVVGSGYSAATNVVALAELASAAPGTTVTWLVRREGIPGDSFPVTHVCEDSLPERKRLAAQANRLAADSASPVRLFGGRSVAAVSKTGEGAFEVQLTGEPPETLVVDQIIANVGFRPETTLYRELQVHECYATEGPMKLAAALAGHAGADCLQQPAAGPQSLVNPEPDFYIVGAKSYGRNPHFLLATGLQQIRQIFTLIADREDLDLYARMEKLPP